MAKSPLRTCIFLPPVRKPTGGITVLYRIGAMLRAAGRAAFMVPREPSVWRPDVAAVPEIPFADLALTPDDLWLVPEGWVNALSPGLAAKSRCLVYVQNWAYLFSGLPPGVSWRGLPVEFLAVSRPVAWFVEQSLGAPVPILRPGIDVSVFTAPPVKPRELSIAWMPRKNKALAEQIRAVFEARGRFKAKWNEIHGLDQAGVAGVLKRSHVFVASGFPEGCPLPPLEAMASGCVPVGFAGLGGWDYMRQIDPAGYVPPCPMDPVAWGGNGFFVPDNDVMGCVLALENALALWQEEGVRLGEALCAGQATARAYSLGAQAQAMSALWKAWEDRPSRSSLKI